MARKRSTPKPVVPPRPAPKREDLLEKVAVAADAYLDARELNQRPDSGSGTIINVTHAHMDLESAVVALRHGPKRII